MAKQDNGGRLPKSVRDVMHKKSVKKPTTTKTQQVTFPEQNGHHLTDLGNAERFATQHGETVRYCHQTGKWYIWRSTHWKVDESAEIMRLARRTVKGIYGEASKADSAKQAKAITSHAFSSESRGRIDAMLKLTESESGIPVITDDLDADPWLFNTASGTIDLRTGELREHRRSDLLTRIGMKFRREGNQKYETAKYDLNATCPRWEKFIDEVFDDDIALAAYIRRAVGYSLTARIYEHVLFFTHGGGANGKSVFLNVLQALLGDYAKTAAPGLLIQKRDDDHPTGWADLCGVRVAACVETGVGRRLNEEMVKWCTGSDRMKARYMRRDFFEFNPSHKLWLSSNHKPIVKGTDEAIWRRIHLIPFTVYFPPEKRDPKLMSKILNELPGIALWAVAGCLEWQERGLDPPTKVVEATEGYRSEMDAVGGWLSECCITGPGYFERSTKLFESFQEHSGWSNFTQTAFGLWLRERGFTKKREPGTGRIGWDGIRLV